MRRSLSVLSVLFLLGNYYPLFSQYEKYPSYNEYTAIMNHFQSDHPEICKIEDFGTSVKGRKLLAAKISDNVSADEAEPAFLYLSTFHGDETGPYVMMLDLIDHLVTNYGTDSAVTGIVDNIETWIVPLANPDGTYSGGDSTVWGAKRFNANEVDLARDFPAVPLNHPCATPKKLMEPETESIIRFCNERHFVISADLHAGMEMILYPWACTSSSHADINWFRYIGKTWTQILGWSGEWHYQSGVIFSPVSGARMDYAAYFQHCRNILAEIYTHLMPPESDLLSLWNAQKASLLFYLEQAMYGISGTVTDSLTGSALEARIFIENHDKDSSHIYAHLPHGDYYRPVYEGSYSIICSAEGYYPKNISPVTVENNKNTRLNIKLEKKPIAIINQKNNTSNLSITVRNSVVSISYFCATYAGVSCTIFDLSGAPIKKIRRETGPGPGTLIWNGADEKGGSAVNGCYIFCLKYDGKTTTGRFVLSS